MAHVLASTLQHASRIGQRRAVKEPHVYVRSIYVDVAERCVSQACNRTAVMQELTDFISACAHRAKPPARVVSQFTLMLPEPLVDGGIAFYSAVKSQQVRFHRRSTLCVRKQR